MAPDPFVCFNLGDEIKYFSEGTEYGLLMKTAGVYPSVSQAWKHGFKGPIPHGFSDFRCEGFDVYIYNPDLEWAQRVDLVQSGYPDYGTDEFGRTIRIYDGNPAMYGPYIDNGGQ